MALSTFYSSIEKGNITYFSKGFKILNIIFIFKKNQHQSHKLFYFILTQMCHFFMQCPLIKTMNIVEPSHETHLVYLDLFDNQFFFEKCVFLNVNLTNFSIYWKKIAKFSMAQN
jgi:hypothetical protein